MPDKKIAIERWLQASDKIGTKLPTFISLAILGKTGAGKSTLANELIGANLFEASEVSPCTTNAQIEMLKLSLNYYSPLDSFVDSTLARLGEAPALKDANLLIVDAPGIGESEVRDDEYANLYADLIGELDATIWVLKADDRALTDDLVFIERVVSPSIGKKPIFLVLNQADKVEPSSDWSDAQNKPSEQQRLNIRKRCEEVFTCFNKLIPLTNIVPLSAKNNYELDTLIYKLACSYIENIGNSRKNYTESNIQSIMKQLRLKYK